MSANTFAQYNAWRWLRKLNVFTIRRRMFHFPAKLLS